MRVASKILRERAERAAQPNAVSASRPAPSSASQSRPGTPSNYVSQATPQGRIIQGRRIQDEATAKARAASRGAKKFGQAVWGPFYHAGSVLWLEVTGLFFALFALFFAQNIYRVRGAWRHGAQHEHFLLYMALTALFVWFSVSSFLRARRKEKNRR